MSKKRSPPKAAAIIAKEMDIPTAVLPGLSHIEIEGDREAVVEGCRSVLEYGEGLIRLNLGKNSVRLMGSDLLINSLNSEKAVITGTILSVEFLGN